MILLKFWKVASAIALSILLAFSMGVAVTTSPFTLAYATPVGTSLFFQGLFLSLAAAIVIAVVVAELVERESAARSAKEIARLEEEARSVSDNALHMVAKNVFGSFYSIDVHEEVVASIFHSPLLRENLLQEITFKYATEDGQSIEMNHLIEFLVINASSSEAIYDARFSFENTLLIYPNNPEYARPALTHVKIGNDEFSPDRIEELRNQVITLSRPGESDLHAIELGAYRIPSQARLSVRLGWRNIEPADSYFHLRMYVPTKKVCVVVRNDIGPSFVSYLSSHFRGNFGNKENLNQDGSHWQRSFDGVILPNCGWILRWNKVTSE